MSHSGVFYLRHLSSLVAHDICFDQAITPNNRTETETMDL